MKPEIVKKDSFTLVGMVSYGGDIGTLWEAFTANDHLIEHTVGEVGYELHAYPKGFSADDPYHIMVGVEVSEIKVLPEIMFAKTLPACDYAVFAHRLGDGGYAGANEPIYHWLESGAYQRAYNFDLQVYDARFKGPEDPDSVLDFFIPVKLRN
jgi:predicted transcriptional regulator YdeE